MKLYFIFSQLDGMNLKLETTGHNEGNNNWNHVWDFKDVQNFKALFDNDAGHNEDQSIAYYTTLFSWFISNQ